MLYNAYNAVTASPFRYIFFETCATFSLRRVALVLANASALGRSISPGEIKKSGSSFTTGTNTLYSNFWDCLKSSILIVPYLFFSSFPIAGHLDVVDNFLAMCKLVTTALFMSRRNSYSLSAPLMPCVDNYI